MPNSGNPIGMNQLNVEFGIAEDTRITLESAENDEYGGGINQNSSSRPDGERPHQLSEWYSYDHSASGWSLTKSILHDGVNDWSRMSGSSYGNICTIFDTAGTIALAFYCTGATSNANQYIWQGGWGGGNNWLLQLRDFSGSAFQVRFRHDFSGNNYISEPHASSGQRPFGLNKWYFVCITYDNGSTSNNATWYYGDYSGTTLTTVTSPVEITTPTGSKNTDTSSAAQYPALSGAKQQVLRPYKGNITLVGSWTDLLNAEEVTTLWNSGAPYQFSNHSDNLLFFHDMASLSGSTMTPETGGSGYTIALTDGASQSTTIPA